LRGRANWPGPVCDVLSTTYSAIGYGVVGVVSEIGLSVICSFFSFSFTMFVVNDPRNSAGFLLPLISSFCISSVLAKLIVAPLSFAVAPGVPVPIAVPMTWIAVVFSAHFSP
jgi:hypothetical protein